VSDCDKDHRYWATFESLPLDQGGAGRHRCAGCAYERGLADGIARLESLDLRLDDLPESQAGSVRHRSPHAAYARGYYDGIYRSYEMNK
jgi:hypothetical protein